MILASSQDGAAAVKHLRDQGVASEHILLHGHSMGAGAASIIREMEVNQGRPTGPLIHDRSFASLPYVINAMARGPLGGIIGAMGVMLPTFAVALCLVLGGSELQPLWDPLRIALAVALSLQCILVVQGAYLASAIGVTCSTCLVATISYFEHRTGALVLERLLVGESLGLCLGFSGLLAPIIGFIAGRLGWDLNAAEAWGKLKGPKAILFHRGDMMIDYYLASLHMRAQEKSGGLFRTRTVELSQYGGGGRKKSPVCHMYPLNTDAAEWREVVGVAAQMLGLTVNRGVGEMASPDVVAGRGDEGVTVTSRNRGVTSAIHRGGGQHIPLHINKGAVDPNELFTALEVASGRDD